MFSSRHRESFGTFGTLVSQMWLNWMKWQRANEGQTELNQYNIIVCIDFMSTSMLCHKIACGCANRFRIDNDYSHFMPNYLINQTHVCRNCRFHILANGMTGANITYLLIANEKLQTISLFCRDPDKWFYEIWTFHFWMPRCCCFTFFWHVQNYSVRVLTVVPNRFSLYYGNR